MRKMRDKLIGWGLIGLSTFLLLWNWDKYADIFYVFEKREVYFRFKDYLIPVVHGTMYLLIFMTGVALGQSFIIQKENKGRANISFIIMLTIWTILALPIYKCEFYGIRHSFWKSRDGHFH